MYRRQWARWSKSGVSEVVGTILILGMTVVLFSVIIIWVTNIPTPEASIRPDMDGALTPIYTQSGNWNGVNVTIEHRGGEVLVGLRTDVYFGVTRNGVTNTAIFKTRGTSGGLSYGINGPDTDWDTGEIWRFTNYSVEENDIVVTTLVDNVRSLVLWSEQLQGAQGTRPPLFLDKWADRTPTTPTLDVPASCATFSLYAKVTDPDGDLVKNSVYVYLAFLYGTPDNRPPQRMYDDGLSGNDRIANDGIFSASYPWFKPPQNYQERWDGGVIIFNATDGAGHQSTSRMTLSVTPGSCASQGDRGDFDGRPPNLNYNGLQGFNIFNGTEWDEQGFNATDTRTFTGNEEVVVIVGSAILKDLFGKNEFVMWDSFSFSPAPVVYGTNKQMGPTTIPSSTQAFSFLVFTNGYNVWIYRFSLNNATISDSCIADGGICFKKTPAHPPEYFFATYSVEFSLTDFLGNQFTATDAITVKDPDGTFRNYPQLKFFRDAAFTLQTNTFNATDNVWVQVGMLNVDSPTDSVSFGTVSIRDFLGGTQVQKAFMNERNVNSPLCPSPLTSCSPGQRALGVDTTKKTYHFRVNLSLADQDPWVDGSQHYSLSIAYVTDTNEQYADLSGQLVIIAPLFRLDVVGGNADTTGPSWGTHDYGYYYENLNGADKWGKTRFEYCGLPGAGSCKNAETRAVLFVDGDDDGDLDIAASLVLDNNNAEIDFFRRNIDSNGNVVFQKFTLSALSGNGVYAKDLQRGDVTGDGFPDLIYGLTTGEVGYFKNDGTWTSSNPSDPIRVDTTRGSPVNGVTTGDFDGDKDIDIAVARADGSVTYYLNLDGRGTFSTGGITDYRYADQESLKVGTYVTPDYLRTLAGDDVREEIEEASQNEPVQTGNTVNSGVDTDSSSWTGAAWEGTSSRTWQGSGGNPSGLLQVDMTQAANQFVSGYWYQSFTITGSPPFSGSVNLDYKVSQYGAGAGGNVKILVFVDTTAGAPTIGTEIASFQETGTTGWKPQTGITVPSSRLPAAGTYYLKIAARTTNGASPTQHTIVQFDNMRLNWQSTGGQASELLHYWRIQQLANRPSTSFFLRVEGQRSVSTDADTFVVGFATDVVGNDPATGTYKNVIWINSTSGDVAYTYTFTAGENANLPNKIVWLRIMDTNHTVAASPALDTVRVDQIHIQQVTQAIPPGSNIFLPTTPGAVTAIDADDQNADGFWDVVVGTANSKVYKLVGYSGGLQVPSGIYYTAPGGTITGIKLANLTSSYTGLDIAFSYTNRVRFIRGDGSSCAAPCTIGTDQTTSANINTLAAGNVDGMGFDDVVVGTANAGAALVYFRNQGEGLSWGRYNIEPWQGGPAITIYDIDLGDASKSQYFGR